MFKGSHHPEVALVISSQHFDPRSHHQHRQRRNLLPEEEMVATSLNANFKEELSATDQCG